MSFAASIIARLGLNTADFRRELAQAATQSVNGHGQMAGAANRNAAAHDNLLRSNHRVARQVQNFTQNLASGADASQLFASGLEGIGRSLNLSLGALAGIGIGVVAVSKVNDVVQEYKKLNKEIDELLAKQRAPARDRTLAGIEEDVNKVTAALAKLREQENATQEGGFAAFVQNLKDALSEPFEIENVARTKRRRHISDLSGLESQDRQAVTSKQARTNDIDSLQGPDFLKQAARLQDSFREKIAETGTPGSAKENQTLSMELRRALEIGLREIADKIADAIKERTQSTLGELAARPDAEKLRLDKFRAEQELDQARSFARGPDKEAVIAAAEQKLADITAQFSQAMKEFTTNALFSGEQARSAQSEIDLADQARLHGDMAGAAQHFNRADQIKNGIGDLKDSEKNQNVEALKGAIDSSEVLLAIREATKATADNLVTQ